MRQSQLNALSNLIDKDGFIRTLKPPREDAPANASGTIFLIMDSFSRSDVQQNISNICEKLMTAFPEINYVFVEGSFDVVDTSPAFYWPKSEVNKMLDEGRLKGPELLSIMRHKDLSFTIQGIDEKNLYEQQHNIMKKTIEDAEKFVPMIMHIQNIIKEAIQNICEKTSNEAFKIIESYESFEKGHIKIVPYGISVKKYTDEIYYNDLTEVRLFLDDIMHGPELSPSLSVQRLLNELDDLFMRILKKNLEQSDNAIFKEFVLFYLQCKNTITLLQFGLSNNGYSKIDAGPNGLKFDRWFSDGVLENACNLIGRAYPVIDLKSIRNALKEAIKFYDVSMERVQPMGDKTLEIMNETYQKTAIVVTGGFHTNMLYSFFYDNNMDVIIILPKIDENSESHYIEIMK